jgi:hypothetical protein
MKPTTIPPTQNITTIPPTSTTLMQPIISTVKPTITTILPKTNITTTTAVQELHSIGLEIMLNSTKINKNTTQIKELFKNYSDNKANVNNIIENANYSITPNTISLALNNIIVNKLLKDEWNEYVTNLKENKTQFILDLLEIGNITNEKVLYISPMFDNKFEINCNIKGCSDSTILNKNDCEYPNYWCDYLGQLLVKN